jgi:hypothetical protein
MSEQPASQAGQFRGAGLLLLWIGWFFALAILTLLVAVWIVSRVHRIEIVNTLTQRSVTVRTPFGVIPIEKPENELSTMMVSFHPRANGLEEAFSVWYRGPAGEEKSAAHLTLLRTHIRAPLWEVDKWYQDDLGSDFTRSKGWLVGDDRSKDDWSSQVQSEPSSEATVFRQQSPGRVRGLLLQPQSSDHGVVASFYEYVEVSSR